jgi:hypothetical protein
VSLALAVATSIAAAPPAARAGELFKDDFSRYPPGPLSQPLGQLNGAIQEYHRIPHRGVATDPWWNPIAHTDFWVIGDEDGRSYLEQHAVETLTSYPPLLITGDPAWTSYTVETTVQPLLVRGTAGVVFRYHSSREHYVFALTGGDRAPPGAAPAHRRQDPQHQMARAGVGAVRLLRQAALRAAGG